MPAFFVTSEADDITNTMAKDKSFVRTIGGKNNTTDLTGVGQEVMKKLLGKTANPMSTIERRACKRICLYK